jgi:hypothetical protein
MHFQFIFFFAPMLRPHEYLDPGSGSFLIQLLIAGIVGAGFIIKMYWKKIKGLFNHSDRGKEEDSDVQK